LSEERALRFGEVIPGPAVEPARGPVAQAVAAVVEQERRGRRAAAIAPVEGRGECQVGAGRIARERDPGRIEPEACRQLLDRRRDLLDLTLPRMKPPPCR
jgi:hypothetical protein